MKTADIRSYKKRYIEERDSAKRELAETQELIKASLYYFRMCI